MCANFEIGSVIFEICIVRERATTSGPLLLLASDTDIPARRSLHGAAL